MIRLIAFVDIVIMVVSGWALLTQVLIPLCYDRPMFPIFRRSKAAAEAKAARAYIDELGYWEDAEAMKRFIKEVEEALEKDHVNRTNETSEGARDAVQQHDVSGRE